MQPIYRAEDFVEARRAYGRVWLMLAVIILAALGVVVTSMAVRIAWMGYAAAVLGVIATLLYWGMRAQPIIGYRRFLLDIDQGMERSVEGVVQSIGTQAEVDQSVETVSVVVLEPPTGPMKRPAERMLHYDRNKLPVPFSVGQRVRLTLFGNNIKGYEVEP